MKYNSVSEIAQKWNITQRQVRNLCMQGKINAIKVGKNWIIPENALRPSKNKEITLKEKFLKDRRIKGLKYNYIIIHGTFGHPGENWFPWIADQIAKLDKSGDTQKEDILIPHFPSSECSNYDSWKSILMGYIDSGIVNKNTIFICHSLGPLFVSRVLIEKKIHIKGMISIEGASGHLMGNPSFDNINKTFFVPSWKYLEKVKDYLEFNYCFYSDNDPFIPLNILKEYVDRAATHSFLINGAGHFNTLSGYSTFPQLLNLIKTIELNGTLTETKAKEMNELWSTSISHMWTNNTWPNRPSVSELSIYLDYVRQYQKKHITNDALILGSNVEYRDWAYEENFNVTIVQDNEEYHLATYRELRHKNAPFKIIMEAIENINFNNKFDYIMGDQIISNLKSIDINSFFKKISNSLKKDGMFFSKTYLKPDNYKKKTLKDIFTDYYNNASNLNIKAYCLFDLTMCFLDDNSYVNFQDMADSIEQCYKNKILKEQDYEALMQIGFDQMKYKFYVPTISQYENIVKKYFKIIDIRYTNDISYQNFPLYILQK